MNLFLDGVLSIFPKKYGLNSVTLTKRLPNKLKICAEFAVTSPVLS